MRYVVLATFIFLISFNILNAQVVISGVQISPIDERFIELHNTSDSEIDLTGWYLQRKTATGSSFGSLVTSSNFENKTIKAGEHFLISRSPVTNADIVLDTLTLTEFNTIRLRDSERNDVDYIELGSIDENEESEQEESSQVQSTSSSSNTINNFPTEQQIFADAGGDRSVVVGADTLFEGKALGLQKEPLKNARYVWNFGNGETKEGQNVLYYYDYPSEYVAILNVSSGQYSATSRIIVNAYSAEIALSKVESNFVEVYNKSNQELNLSWWQLEAQEERFMIPKDTIVLPNKKLILAKNITGLDTSVKESVSLLYPNGVEAISFFQMKIPQKTVAVKKTVTLPKVSPIEKEFQTSLSSMPEGRPSSAVIEEQEETPILSIDSGQAASVISSIKNTENGSNIYKWLLAIFSIIVVSGGIIVYASGKRELGENIEIIE
ncbi:MAG: lamin tail domain-containing protein [Parcubacteria group bacterium]|nr:lamin tail domain-containing protein [Parcubacteria group bacterium]